MAQHIAYVFAVVLVQTLVLHGQLHKSTMYAVMPSMKSSILIIKNYGTDFCVHYILVLF